MCLFGLFASLLFSLSAIGANVDDDHEEAQQFSSYVDVLTNGDALTGSGEPLRSTLQRLLTERGLFFGEHCEGAQLQKIAAVELKSAKRLSQKFIFDVGCDENVCKNYWACWYCSYILALKKCARLSELKKPK